MTAARCPKCHIEVGATWRWCLACGYDPDGSAQRVRQAAIERRQREGGWLPVVIVLAGLLVGGVILWRTTPDESMPTVSSSTAAEVTAWEPFTPPGAGFSVDLPATPLDPAQPTTPQTTPAGRPVEAYLIGTGGHLFTVTIVDTGRPDLTADAGGALRERVDELAASMAGTVEESTDTTVGDAPAVDFRIASDTLGEMRGRALAVGSRVGTVSVSSRELADEIVDHLIGSVTVP